MRLLACTRCVVGLRQRTCFLAKREQWWNLVPARSASAPALRALTRRPQLREALQLGSLPAHSPAARYATDACLCRYLRARAWDVGKAQKMLQASLKWRAVSGVDALRYSEVQAECATGKMHRLHCRDRKGRPVLVLRPALENTREAKGQIRFLTWNMEALMRAMPKGQGGFPLGADVDLATEQMMLLVDFTGYSIFNAPPTKTSMETLHIMLNHYPERLGSAVCLSAPTLFTVVYAMMQPFMDARTVAKIHFVDASSAAGLAQLNSLVDLSRLHKSLGGTGTEGGAWDAAAYDARALAEEQAFRNAEEQAKAELRRMQAEATGPAAAATSS